MAKKKYGYNTNKAIAWAKARIADKKRTGELTRLACRRFLKDLDSGTWDYRDDLVENACMFIQCMVPPSGEQFGATLKLFDWQRFVICNLEGFRVKGEVSPKMWPQRRFSEASLFVARKAGKTSFAAALALMDLTRANRKESNQILAAKKEDQANIAYKACVSMVSRNKALQEVFSLKATVRAIKRQDANGGELYRIPASTSTLDGLRPTFILLDEIHAIEDRDLLSVLEGGTGATHSPLVFMPSTAGTGLETLGRGIRDSHVKVLKGDAKVESIFSLIFEPDDDDDMFKENTWRKANPGIGTTIPLSYYENAAHKAKNDRKAEVFFLTRQCNVWRGTSASQWIDMAQWDACADPLTKMEDLQDFPMVIGVDAAKRHDLTSICFLFQVNDGGYHAFFECYLPRATIEKRDNQGNRFYGAWRDEKHLLEGGDAIIESEFIAERIEAVCAKYRVKKIVFDQFAGSDEIASYLSYDVQSRCRKLLKQGKTITPSCNELEARLNAGKLFAHDGNPVAAWCASNVHVSRLINKSLVPKKISENSDQKIDAIDALLVAIAGLKSRDVGQRSEPIRSEGTLPDLISF